MIIASQVVQDMSRIGADPMCRMFLDSKFAIADQISMVDFWEKFYAALAVMDLLDWSEEDWDCEDFAIIAWGFMKAAYRMTHKREHKELHAGINLGIFGYETKKGNHMASFQPTHEGIIFFEPQPQNGVVGKQISLTPEEVGSCFAYAI